LFLTDPTINCALFSQNNETLQSQKKPLERAKIYFTAPKVKAFLPKILCILLIDAHQALPIVLDASS